MPRGRPRKWSPEQTQKMVDLARTGMAYKKIAMIMNDKDHAIKNALKRYGVYVTREDVGKSQLGKTKMLKPHDNYSENHLIEHGKQWLEIIGLSQMAMNTGIFDQKKIDMITALLVISERRYRRYLEHHVNESMKEQELQERLERDISDLLKN